MAEETNWKLEAEKWKKKSLELGEKENVYVAKLKEAKEFIEKLTSPPLRQALIIRIGEDNVDIAYGNGNVDVVNYNEGKLFLFLLTQEIFSSIFLLLTSNLFLLPL